MIYLVLAAAYLVGSIPFGYIITKMVSKDDIRKLGSGNIGATNVLRVLGWRAAAPVFLFDALKGFAPVLLAKAVSDISYFHIAAGLLSMIGHSFPLFLGFKGGKAVATGIGVLTALSLPVTLVLIGWAGLIVAVTRYVSLGSIIGSLTVPLLFWYFGYDLAYILFGLAMAILVTARHHANIKRLLNGTESKLCRKA